MLASLMLAALAWSSGAARAVTLVSLTFDDGSAGQAQAGQILAARGLSGTFYVNGDKLGTTPFYLSVTEAARLQAEGMEIGSHTLDHVDVSKVAAPIAREQICGDRARLQSLGFNPVSFAYPYGHDGSTEQIVRSCGFTSGRSDGGVDRPGAPAAEGDPPRDLYAIRTVVSFEETTTLSEMEAAVTRAEGAGGGWVVLVFHLVCDGCGPLSTSPATLSAFADWLAARAALGTYVLPVGEVAAGERPPSLDARGARAYPNPWRADLFGGVPVTLDRLPVDSTVKIYTPEGGLLRTLSAPGGLAQWDLRDAAGRPVASGFYVFVAVSGDKLARGVVSVVR